MSVSHRYRNFGSAKGSAQPNSEGTSEAAEEQKLQAFEAGYQAGWDDAIKARAEEKEKLSADLAKNLLEMSLTYEEALSKLTVSLEPAMRLVIEKLLPEMERASLANHVLEQVQKLMGSQLERPVEIVVNPNNRTTVEGLVGSSLTEPFSIVGDASLGEGQAFVRVGDAESQVDLETLISEVSKAMTAFFHEAGKEMPHG